LKHSSERFQEKLVDSDGVTLDVKELAESCPAEYVSLEKLNKGLFYMMWHSDKQPVQEALAGTMVDLLNYCSSSLPYTLLFSRAFFRTLSREWTGLDQYRTSKYMRWVRVFYRKLLSIFTAKKSLPALFDCLGEAGQGPLDHETGQTLNTPLGIRLHMIDLFIDEWKVHQFGEEIMEIQDFSDFEWPAGLEEKRQINSDSWKMLRPLALLVLRTSHQRLRDHVYANIFETLIEEADITVDLIRTTPGIDEAEISGLVNQPRLQIDFGKVADEIYKLSNDAEALGKTIKQSNRNRAYKLIERLREVAANVVPISENTPDTSDFEKFMAKEKKERRQRHKENQRFRKRLRAGTLTKPSADDSPTQKKHSRFSTSCDDLLSEEDSGVAEESLEETPTTSAKPSKTTTEEKASTEESPSDDQPSTSAETLVDPAEDDEFSAKNLRRVKREKKSKQQKKKAKQWKQLQKALAHQDSTTPAPTREEVDQSLGLYDDIDDALNTPEEDVDLEKALNRKPSKLKIRLDLSQTKYYQKKSKLKYETSAAFDPERTPTKSILKKRPSFSSEAMDDES